MPDGFAKSKQCFECGKPLIRRPKERETKTTFLKRRFCNLACFSRARSKRAEARNLTNFAMAPGGCWIWLGKTGVKGYGRLTYRRKTVSAHHFFFEHYNGPVPKGLELHHTCEVHPCVNPDHLHALSRAEHEARHLKLLCVRGHPLDGPNLAIYRKRNGKIQRRCRLCVSDHYAKKKDRINAQARARYWADPEYRDAINTRKRERNASDPQYRETMRVKSREYHAKNKDAQNAKRREYIEKNRQAIYAKNREYYARLKAALIPELSLF